MALTSTDKALLLAAYFRGGSQEDNLWTSNTDQILTLSLFYTGEISSEECASRFSNRGYVGCLYDGEGELTHEVEMRYRALIGLLRKHPELIEGGGNFETPAYPTFTACRLTEAGFQLAVPLVDSFPRKPDFPNWPDKRAYPNRE